MNQGNIGHRKMINRKVVVDRKRGQGSVIFSLSDAFAIVVITIIDDESYITANLLGELALISSITEDPELSIDNNNGLLSLQILLRSISGAVIIPDKVVESCNSYIKLDTSMGDYIDKYVYTAMGMGMVVDKQLMTNLYYRVMSASGGIIEELSRQPID